MTETAEKNVILYNALILDGNPDRQLLKAFAARAIRATVAKNQKFAQRYIDQGDFNIVMVSTGFEGTSTTGSLSGILDMIRCDYPEMPIIMLGEIDSSRPAANAIQAGFNDYLAKPLDEEMLNAIIDKFMPNNKTEVIASARNKFSSIYHIVGSSSHLARTVSLAKKVAATSTPVMVSGESGTGKELIAHLIHNNSKRADGPYVRVNCASLSESLIESELFGHEKGAFTGAQSRRKGRFERAHGGTILLDEITETPISFQSQLLRVLEHQDIERVGSNDAINVNVRVISTTNRDILAEVAAGNFRADLYYRLAGIRLVVDPLRERMEDILPLTWHFINELAPEAGRSIEQIDPLMLDVLYKYQWPGNVRQLRNVIRTSLVLGSGSTLSLADVSWLLEEIKPHYRPVESTLEDFLGSTSLVEIEKQAIVATLKQTGGNQIKAAKILGISDRTIREKIKQYKRSESLVAAG